MIMAYILLECWFYHYVMSNVSWVFEFIIMVCFELWLWHLSYLNVEFIFTICFWVLSLWHISCLNVRVLLSWYVFIFIFIIYMIIVCLIILNVNVKVVSHVRIQKVLPEGVQLWRFFMRWERIQIELKVGHHWPASKTPFKWHFTGRLIMAQHRKLAW